MFFTYIVHGNFDFNEIDLVILLSVFSYFISENNLVQIVFHLLVGVDLDTYV